MGNTPKLAGKVALITGGSTGIGLATAHHFIAEGAFVFLTGRRQAELDAAVQQLGSQAQAIRSDVSSLADLDQLFARIHDLQGHLDIVFANAGGGSFASLAAATEAQFDQEFNANVKGAFFTVQKALPLLREGASIILTASMLASKGLENISVYSAAKAAVRSFARTWTSDLKARRIRVNAISPGPTDTPGFTHNLPPDAAVAAQVKAHIAAGIPLGRLAQADDIARAVVFLASDDSSFITGTELFVDGGTAQI